MGQCTITFLKRNTRPHGRANLVRINLSSSYATGGDTLARSTLGIGNRISIVEGNLVTSPAGHPVEVVYGANEFTNPLLRVRDAATGAEIASTTNLSAQSVVAEVYNNPYR